LKCVQKSLQRNTSAQLKSAKAAMITFVAKY